MNFCEHCLHTLLPNDENNNSIVCTNAYLLDCKNCVVHAVNETKVVVQGLDGNIIAESTVNC